ncbi:MAG: glycosyltransferase family 4 protein [Chitinophagaceae bacterium]
MLCSRLDLPGGIERAVVNAANLFVEKGHKVTLLVLDETDNSFYPIEPTVKLIQQPLSFGITPEGNIITRKIKMLSDVLKLRRLLKRLEPDLIIASEYPLAVAAVLSNAKKKSKLVSWEHHHFHELEKNKFWTRLFRLAYSRLDAVVCLNEDERKLYHSVNPHPVVIPNFISANTETSARTSKQILTVGRIASVKGTDMLVKAATIVLKKHPDWKWKIIGNSSIDDDFSRNIYQQQLPDGLTIQTPVSHDIGHEYKDASLYVMTSRNECFPMTLLEAMSFGLPCISFDCDTGPRHIIEHDYNGLLVEKENVVKLAKAVSASIRFHSLMQVMGRNAHQSVQSFLPETIYRLWQKEIFTL